MPKKYKLKNIINKSKKIKKKILKQSKNISKQSKNLDNILGINKKNEEDFYKDCVGYEYQPTVLPAVENLYAIGDIHGDLKVAIDSLFLAKVIDKNYSTLVKNNIINKEILNKISESKDSNYTSEKVAKDISDNINWTGKDSVIVQVGDQVDRCRPKEKMCHEEGATIDDEPSDLLILYLMTFLDKKARVHNGKIVSLFGNHELMQTFGNFNYVSKKNLDIFENKEDRVKRFEKGNKFAKFLACTRISAIIVGSNIFIHAGIIPNFIKKQRYGNKNKSKQNLDQLNKYVRKYLLDKTTSKNIEYILKNRNSIFWTRVLGNIPPNVNSDYPDCEKYLSPVLELYDCKNMIVGHTPQSFQPHNHGINTTCKSKDNNGLHRVDVGSSKAFQGFDNKFSETSEIMKERDIQILKIHKDKNITILKM